MASVKVDHDLCIGCGLCVVICPGVFELQEDKEWIIHPKILEMNKKRAVPVNTSACETSDCLLAADVCPVAAIIIE